MTSLLIVQHQPDSGPGALEVPFRRTGSLWAGFFPRVFWVLAWVLQPCLVVGCGVYRRLEQPPFRTRRCVRHAHPAVGRPSGRRSPRQVDNARNVPGERPCTRPRGTLSAGPTGVASHACRVSYRSAGDARARLPMQVAIPDVCGLRSRRRGSALPDKATYRRVSVLDVASCAKKGSFQPSINAAADHETGLAEPKQRQRRRVATRRACDGCGDPVVAEPELGRDRTGAHGVDPMPFGPTSFESDLQKLASADFAAL